MKQSSKMLVKLYGNLLVSFTVIEKNNGLPVIMCYNGLPVLVHKVHRAAAFSPILYW